MGAVRTDPDERAVASPHSVRLARIPALDGLRGVAVLAVLWFHGDHLLGGYLGVDLFFVLSGFLITSLLIVEWRDTGTIRLGSFWARRARRLLPALVLVLVVVGVVSHWEVLPGARGQLRDAGLATLGYGANWYAVATGNDYWSHALQPSWLRHTWSLSIEEQFYLVWPLVVIGVLRIGRGRPGATPDRAVRRLGWVAAAGATVSAGLMIGGSLVGFGVDRLYLGTDTRAAAVLIGGWAACWQRSGRRPPIGSGRRILTGGGLAAGIGLVVAWTHLSGSGPALYRGGLLACGLAAMVVIVDVSTPGPSLVRPMLEVSVLRWFGAISYGLYLWHWPVYQALYPGRFGLTGWPLMAVRVAVSVAIAVASLVLVERPILERRWRVPLAPLVPVAIAAAVVALVVGASGAVDPAPTSGRGTASADRGAGTPTVMVVGDSVAYALAEDGLIPEADRGSGLHVVDRASIGCTLMRDVGDPVDEVIRNCSPDWPAALREVDPDVVVLLIGGYAGVVPVPLDGRDAWPCEPSFDRRWEERLDDAVTTLSSSGAKVVLVTAPTAAMGAMKGPDPERFDDRQACTNRVVSSVAADHPDAVLVDLSRWTCPSWPSCRDEVDGVTLRPDGVHFTDEGARVVARWLGPQLRAAAS